MSKIDELQNNTQKFCEELGEFFDKIHQQVHQQFTDLQLANTGKVYLVGDGVGYAAALSLKDAFRAHTAWSGQYISAVTLNGFVCAVDDQELSFGKNLVVILNSEPDQEQMIAKVTQRAQKSSSDVVLFSHVGDACLSYMQLFASGFALSLCVGVAQGKLTCQTKQNLINHVCAYAKKVENNLSVLAVQCRLLACAHTDEIRNYETIGTGMDYGVAWFSRLLVYREIGAVTTVEESEDYLHVNALNIESKQYQTFVFNSKNNPAYDRTLLTINNIHAIERKMIVISDGEKSDLRCECPFVQLPTCSVYSAKALFGYLPAAMVCKARSQL